MRAPSTTKKELIDAIGEMLFDEHGVSYAAVEVERFLDSTTAVIAALLESSRDVSLTGIGKLVVSHRDARWVNNPQGGEQIYVPAKRVVKLRPAKALKDALAG